MDKRFFRPIVAWCFYDWASSAFSSIIITFIFATYFTKTVAINTIVGTYQWGNASSIAGIIIALLSPLLGAIADYGGHHKRWLFFFTLMAVVFSSLLWFSYPNPSSVFYTLTIYIIATISFEVAQVFYNAFLPTLGPRSYLGRISGWGWGFGYLGGIFALSFALFFLVKGNIPWLDKNSYEQIRITGPFVGLWYFLFSLPLFIYLPSLQTNNRPFAQAVRTGFQELMRTIRWLWQEKNILRYLIAHMIYIDGLNTLFAFGGIYAAGTFHMNFEEVLWFGITMNITAGLGALLLAFMDDWIGSKKTVLLSLAALIFFGCIIIFVQHKFLFWALALALSAFVGPIQSASRSLMVHLIKDNQAKAELFGLYAFSGKITAFIGPWLFGLATLSFSSQRVGVATVLLFFIAGGLLLTTVKILHNQ